MKLDPAGTGALLPPDPAAGTEQQLAAPEVATNTIDSTVDLETNKSKMPKGGEI